MNENATFIIHQGVCNVKHPFDLQADNIGGIFRRKDQVCLYETVRNDGKETSLSSEVHVEKENGKVIGDKINSKMCGKWEQREASLKNVYVVVRKRAGHKKSKESGASLVWYIMFVMTLEEYNSEIWEYEEKRCACSSANHQSREDLEDAVLTSNAPKNLLSHIQQYESSILAETNTIHNIQQIYNYRKNSNRENENPDPCLELVRALLDPEVDNPNEYFNVLDHTQAFVREVSSEMLLRAGFFNEI